MTPVIRLAIMGGESSISLIRPVPIAKGVTMLATRLPRRRGLTVLDFLVILVVIIVVVGLFSVALYRSLGVAKETGAANNLRNLGQALHLYHSDNQIFPAGFDAAKSKSFYYFIAGDLEAELKLDAQAKNPKPNAYFLCPERRKVADCMEGAAPADFGFAVSTAKHKTILGGPARVALRQVSGGDGTENTIMLTVISVKPADYCGSKADSPWPSTNYARDSRRFVLDSSPDAGGTRMGSPLKGSMPALFASGGVRMVSYDIDDAHMQMLWTYDAHDDRNWNLKIPPP